MQKILILISDTNDLFWDPKQNKVAMTEPFLAFFKIKQPEEENFTIHDRFVTCMILNFNKGLLEGRVLRMCRMGFIHKM